MSPSPAAPRDPAAQRVADAALTGGDDAPGQEQTGGSVVQLHVRTVRIEEPVDLLAHIPADLSAAWIRHGQGMVALGSAWSVRTTGEQRFAAARAAFTQLAARARVDDEVRARASGLIALGSFSYAASSPRPSRLTVPQAVLGVIEGEAFLTVVGIEEEPTLPDSWQDLFPAAPAEEESDDAAARAVPTGAASSGAVPTGAASSGAVPTGAASSGTVPSGAVPSGTPPPGTPPSAHTGELTLEPAHTPAEYQQLVREAIARIRDGQAHKVVLSERITATSPQSLDPALLVTRLARAYPSTWVYFLDDVVGASPEMLAQTQDGRVFSRVLAGSRPVADDGELEEADRRAFRTDAKERSEHLYAVESVTSRLEDLAAQLEVSPEPFVLRLPGLEHLASDVSAQLRAGVTSLDVAARLHPSAAVSGTSREQADQIIAALEPADRGGYASPVGWMDARGDGQWAIALRMAHLTGEREAVLQAGGGLVEASDPVAEHAEVLAKTRPMLRALRRDRAG
ncbi:chorismate-binding protein [Brachybacterium sp. Marseille-Q7125]|uniref:isochorismate synthase n=1 Tax=Brachybacterium sp. Marseille-Q7125 TaxID=2932815 RepID=UPI001FF11085|nr:chorismate-binding protein [Brachybacterium sp. Marseille-Q7125]